MRKSNIVLLLAMSHFACMGFESNAGIALDITHLIPVVRNGRVFTVRFEVSTREIGAVQRTTLVYVGRDRRIYPEKNIRDIEELFLDEGFEWSSVADVVRVFIPSFARLYLGMNTALLDENFYSIHLEADPHDSEELLRLKRMCAPPSVEVVGNKWRLTLCVMEERIGMCPVERYTVEGNTSPFKIERCIVQELDSVVLKHPVPR